MCFIGYNRTFETKFTKKKALILENELILQFCITSAYFTFATYLCCHFVTAQVVKRNCNTVRVWEIITQIGELHRRVQLLTDFHNALQKPPCIICIPECG